MLEDQRLVAVNEVILSCSDAADQYETASSIVEDLNLREFFLRLVEARRVFVSSLEEGMRSLEKLPMAPDAEKEALESLWMRIKATVKKNHEEVLLQEGVRLEKHIRTCTEKALKQELPAQLLQTLEEMKQEADGTLKILEKEIDRREAG